MIRRHSRWGRPMSDRRSSFNTMSDNNEQPSKPKTEWEKMSPKDRYTAQIAEEDAESMGEGARREMFED